MVKLIIDVPAPDKERCGFCTLLSRPAGWCVLFAERLVPAKSWGFLRSEECQAAQDEAERLTK